MPSFASSGTIKAKREFKRGFWWTLGAVTAYALVAAGIALFLAAKNEPGSAVMPLGQIEDSNSCATGSCAGVWAR